MKHIRNYFITGLIAILPIAITLWILSRIFQILDNILGQPIKDILGFRIPGLGLILGLLLVLVIGMITSNVFGKRLTAFIDNTFERIPILKTIYLPVKDIMNNFTSSQSNNFKRAVFVEYPRHDCWSIGFITKENIMVNGENKTVIFVPTTPNPTSGFIIYLTRGEYRELDIPVDVALKSIISLGVISPQQINIKRNV